LDGLLCSVRSVGPIEAVADEGRHFLHRERQVVDPLRIDRRTLAQLRFSDARQFSEPERADARGGALVRMEIAQQLVDGRADLEALEVDVAHLVEETEHFLLEPGITQRLAAQMLHIDRAANLLTDSFLGNGPRRVLATHLAYLTHN
jgi:hypothetical protein